MWEKYKFLIFIAALFILVLAALSMNSFRNKELPNQNSQLPTATPTPEGIGSEIYEDVSNPTENIPQANPFESKTNPYDSYKNPFE